MYVVRNLQHMGVIGLGLKTCASGFRLSPEKNCVLKFLFDIQKH